jgi:hypothetical protein
LILQLLNSKNFFYFLLDLISLIIIKFIFQQNQNACREKEKEREEESCIHVFPPQLNIEGQNWELHALPVSASYPRS